MLRMKGVNTKDIDIVNIIFTAVVMALYTDKYEYDLLICGEQNGRNALLLAANVGELEMVKFLMNEGEDINFKDNVCLCVEIDVKYDRNTRYLL